MNEYGNQAFIMCKKISRLWVQMIPVKNKNCHLKFSKNSRLYSVFSSNYFFRFQETYIITLTTRIHGYVSQINTQRM